LRLSVQLTDEQVWRTSVVAIDKIHRNNPLDKDQSTQIAKYRQKKEQLWKELAQYSQVMPEVSVNTNGLTRTAPNIIQPMYKIKPHFIDKWGKPELALSLSPVFVYEKFICISRVYIFFET